MSDRIDFRGRPAPVNAADIAAVTQQMHAQRWAEMTLERYLLLVKPREAALRVLELVGIELGATAAALRDGLANAAKVEALAAAMLGLARTGLAEIAKPVAGGSSTTKGGG